MILATIAGSTIGTALAHHAPVETAVCDTYRITGYSVAAYPGRTADGSTTTTGAMARGEWIAAASYNIPFGAQVEIEGIGTYRVVDRGHLGARHIDVLVMTDAEAYALTSTRRACWWT